MRNLFKRSPKEERIISAFRDAVDAVIEVDKAAAEPYSSEQILTLESAKNNLLAQEDRFIEALRDYINGHEHGPMGVFHLPHRFRTWK